MLTLAVTTLGLLLAPHGIHTVRPTSRSPHAVMAAPKYDEEVVAAATAAVQAAATTAKKYAVKGGNGGDVHGTDGIQPVIAAAAEAAKGSDLCVWTITEAGNSAAVRTNANAARVADAIIVAAMQLGASRPAADGRHPITDAALYNGLAAFSAVPFDPEAE